MIHSYLTIHLAFLALLIVQSKEKVSSMHKEMSTISGEQSTQTWKMVDASTMTNMSMIYIKGLEQECVSNRSSSLSDT